MARASLKEKILHEGLRVVHEKGFCATSVRDIVQAAGVPQGSFTNHFTSKEAFGMEILNLYFENSQELINETLLNNSLKPLDRLRGYVEAHKEMLSTGFMEKGCLYGNFTAEASESSESIRLRLVEIYAWIKQCIELAIAAAVAQGELGEKYPAKDVASHIVLSLQGAMLVGKAERTPVAMQSFINVLFTHVLR